MTMEHDNYLERESYFKVLKFVSGETVHTVLISINGISETPLRSVANSSLCNRASEHVSRLACTRCELHWRQCEPSAPLEQMILLKHRAAKKVSLHEVCMTEENSICSDRIPSFIITRYTCCCLLLLHYPVTLKTDLILMVDTPSNLLDGAISVILSQQPLVTIPA